MKRNGPVLLALAVALLLSSFGCSTCPARCCATCPPELVVVEPPPVVIHEPAPELPVADMPELTCAWPAEVAAADPEGWLEAVLVDLAAVINAALDYRQTILDANATRPRPPE